MVRSLRNGPGPYNLPVGDRGRTVRAGLVIAFGGLVLLMWLARARYGRWIADDYCFATLGWRDGFWRGQAFMYARLNGRISVSFLMVLITSMGRFTTPVLAVAMMMAWLAGAWLAVRHAFVLAQAHASVLEEIAGALVFVAAIVSVAPNSDQPLIWLLGLVTYGLPIVCATWLAVLVLRPPSPAMFVAVAALAFLAGGCSEVAAAAQLIFLTMLVPFAKRFRALIIAADIASAAALVVECLSSGNAVRRALFQPLPIAAAAAKALAGAPITLTMLLLQGAAPFGMLIVFFALAGDREKRVSPAIGIIALLTMVPIVAMTLFGGFYGTGQVPWARVQFVPVAYVTVALLVAALGLPRPTRASVAIGLTALAALLVITEMVSTTTDGLDAMHDARRFAIDADRVDEMARQRRRGSLVVRAPREYDFLEFLSPDPDHWTNRCMATYYGLTSIRTPLPSGR